MKCANRSAFTLIELLIVVAIIAILAAIAVPNFLEAQTRSKVARVKSDLRTQATALEAYAVDNNGYTRDSDSDLDRESAWNALPYGRKANGATQLTTPIAYMTSILTDPFAAGQFQQATGGTAFGYRIGSGTWSYAATEASLPDEQNAFDTFSAKGKSGAYVTLSPGPGKKRARMSYKCFPYKPVVNEDGTSGPNFYEDYDPTNGTVSAGDIYRFGGNFLSGDWDRNALGAGPRGPESL